MASTLFSASKTYINVTAINKSEANGVANMEMNIKRDRKSFKKIKTKSIDADEVVLINEDDYSNSSFLDMYETAEESSTNDYESRNTEGETNNKEIDGKSSYLYNGQLPRCNEKILNNMQNITEYGFLIPDNKLYQEYSQWYNSKFKIESQRLKQFEKEFAKTVINDNEMVTLDYQNRVYQFAMENGIPSKYRFFLWSKYTNLNSYKEYKKLLEQYKNRFTEALDIPDKEIINNDLLRTFPTNIHFMTSPNIDRNNMIDTLEQQLSLFSILHKRDVGYCQSLNYLCGLVLLISPSNSNDDGYRRYELLNTLVTKIGISFYDNTLSGLMKFQETLLVLIYHYLPDLFVILFNSDEEGDALIDSILEQEDKDGTANPKENIEMPVLMIYLSKWVLNCFINILPFEFCLRIVDLIILTNEDGITWIYKITLVLLDIALEEFRKSDYYKHNASTNSGQQEKKLKHSLSLKLNKVLKHNSEFTSKVVPRKSIRKSKDKNFFQSSNGLEMEFLKLLTDLYQQEKYGSLEFDSVILKRLNKSQYKDINMAKIKKHLFLQRMTRKEKLKYRLKLKKLD